MVVVTIIVRRANVDQLFEAPSVGHSGDHLSQLIFVALEYPVDMLACFPGTVVPVALLDLPLHQLDQLCYVVELGLLQHT